MKLPTWVGETAPVEREKNQQGRLEGIFADPLLPGGGDTVWRRRPLWW